MSRRPCRRLPRPHLCSVRSSLSSAKTFGGWSPVAWRGLSGALRRLEEEFGSVFLTQVTPRSIDRHLSRRRREDGISIGDLQSIPRGPQDAVQARIRGYVEDLPTDALTDGELERLLETLFRTDLHHRRHRGRCVARGGAFCAGARNLADLHSAVFWRWRG